VWLEGGTPIQDLIGDAYTLLRLGRTEVDAFALERAMCSLGAPFATLTIDDEAARDVYGYDLILLRPDMHVAWRGNAPPADPAHVATLVTGH
jgi:hypothetical protein